MVDLAEIQSVYYMIAATGVLVAVFYNILNMRETARNRRVTFTTSLLSTLRSKEGIRDYYELMSMQWVDFDDFKKKYDSRVNPENFIKRDHYWRVCDNVGWQLRTGVVDWDTVRKSGSTMMNMWRKFGSIIEDYRRTEYRIEIYSDWEYLADRMEEDFSLEDKKKAQYMIDDGFRNENTRVT
jgi:hypothetical protein